MNKNKKELSKKHRTLVINLEQAKRRLDEVQARSVEVEKANPKAFVEIRQAKQAVETAKTIVRMYLLQVASVEAELLTE